MSDKNIKIAIHSIPDDPESSTYRFIIVAAKRARQLQNGARSFLPTTSKKPTIASMEEVRRGLVKYDDPNRVETMPGAEGHHGYVRHRQPGRDPVEFGGTYSGCTG